MSNIEQRIIENEIEKSLGNDFSIEKAFDTLDIVKGKRAQLGEIREWRGGRFRRTANGWEKIKEGAKGEKKDPDGVEGIPGVDSTEYQNIISDTTNGPSVHTLTIDGKKWKINREIDRSGGQHTPYYVFEGGNGKMYWDLNAGVKAHRSPKEESSKTPTSVKIDQKTFRVKDGKIQASMYDTQKRISKLMKFAKENGYQIEWMESKKKYGDMNVEDVKKKKSSLKEELDHHNNELDNLENKKEDYIKRHGEEKYNERHKKIEDKIEDTRKELDNLKGLDKAGSNEDGDGFEEAMEKFSEMFYNGESYGKLKKYLDSRLGEGTYDRILKEASSRTFEESSNRKDYIMSRVEDAFLNKI